MNEIHSRRPSRCTMALIRSTQEGLCCSRLGRRVQHFGHQRPNGCDFDWFAYDTPHYGHQVWVPETHDHAFFGDELDELNEGGPTRTVVFDLTDLDAPNVAEMFEASVDATDHNQYNHGEWLFQSNYNAGVRMLSDAWPSVLCWRSAVI